MTADAVPASRATLMAFGFPPDAEHAPMSPVDVPGAKFRCPCRCGYEGKSTSTPSHAYNATRVHAEAENARKTGGTPAASTPYRRAVVSSATSRPRAGQTAGPCACGCGTACGGLFAPGHDSKLLSRLQSEIKSGAKTLEVAIKEMTDIGTSDKLKDKLRSRVS